MSTTGFKITHCDLGNLIHVFYFSQCCFSQLTRKSQYQKIYFIFSKQRNKTFLLATFYENNFVFAACTLKIQGINHN